MGILHRLKGAVTCFVMLKALIRPPVIPTQQHYQLLLYYRADLGRRRAWHWSLQIYSVLSVVSGTKHSCKPAAATQLPQLEHTS